MTYKKLAVFVEGQTESIFTKKLLREIAGTKSISFRESKAKELTRLSEIPTDDKDIKYFVLIVDCGNDETVKSRILENRDSLIRANYTLVLGLRDLYPHPRENLEHVLQGLYTRVPTKDIQIELCLAVMEVEAWFLQEEKHFQLIDASLTNAEIVDKVGFNPETDNAELVEVPAQLLRAIYNIAGKSYKKSRKHVERTVSVLDYENLYLNLPNRLKCLRRFLGYIDEFMVH
jgi:hypothetical protein